MEPVTITIPKSELEEWQRKIRAVMPPSVPFGEPPDMLKAAYEERGNVLYYLNHRLSTFGFLSQ
jgi:hypothetical protein